MFAGFSVPDWLAGVGVLAGAIAALLAAAGVIAKSPIGKSFVWVYRRLFGEPLTDLFQKGAKRALKPDLHRLERKVDALEVKNDLQHGENKSAIHKIDETLTEHRVETRDHLFELRQQAIETHNLLIAHFGEAQIRDQRITALEEKREGQ